MSRYCTLVKPRAGKRLLASGAPDPGGSLSDTRPDMRKAIVKLGEMLVIARVSKTVMPVRVATGMYS